MTDLPPNADTVNDSREEADARSTLEQPPRRPRWVKVSGIIVVVLILVVVALLLFGPESFGPGQHGPGRHMPVGGQSPPAQQP